MHCIWIFAELRSTEQAAEYANVRTLGIPRACRPVLTVLTDHYPQLLHLHVGCVILSGSLFSIRAVLRIANNPLANHRALRILSYLIDTTLLIAAILLTLILHQYPFVNSWLTAKVLLLVLYIAVGTVALKRARTAVGRALAMGVALAIFGYIIGVAVRHDPAGWLLSR